MKKLILFLILFPLLSYGQLYIEYIDLKTETRESDSFNVTLIVVIKSHSIKFKTNESDQGNYYIIKSSEVKGDRISYYAYDTKSGIYRFIDIFYEEKVLIMNIDETLVLTGDIKYEIEEY